LKTILIKWLTRIFRSGVETTPQNYYDFDQIIIGDIRELHESEIQLINEYEDSSIKLLEPDESARRSGV